VSLSHKTTSEKSQADIFSFPLTSDTATAADQVAKLSVIATPFPKQVEFSRPTASHPIMIFSRAWFALMRRNFVYRRRNWIGTVRCVSFLAFLIDVTGQIIARITEKASMFRS